MPLRREFLYLETALILLYCVGGAPFMPTGWLLDASLTKETIYREDKCFPPKLLPNLDFTLGTLRACQPVYTRPDELLVTL